jgi:hypothetical protein
MAVGAAESASREQAGKRDPEPAIGAKSRATGGRQLVSSAAGIALAAEQPIAFAAVQRLMQDCLAGGLLAQAADLPRAAARAKQSAMDGVKDRELDMPERISRLHAPSVGPAPASHAGRGSRSAY